MLNQASVGVKAAGALVVANWLVWSAICLAVGGSALLGDVVAGQFFLRRHPNSVPVFVSPEFWTFSLFYSLATFGGTFLALSLLYISHRPSWDRGLSDAGAVFVGSVVLVLVVLQAWPALTAWAAV